MHRLRCAWRVKGDQGEIVDLVKVKGKHAGEGEEANVAHNVCMVRSFPSQKELLLQTCQSVDSAGANWNLALVVA